MSLTPQDQAIIRNLAAYAVKEQLQIGFLVGTADDVHPVVFMDWRDALAAGYEQFGLNGGWFTLKIEDLSSWLKYIANIDGIEAEYAMWMQDLKLPPKPAFECHITFVGGDARAWQLQHGVAHWKYSRIDGDPVLGDAVFQYLTAYHNDLQELLDRMKERSAWLRSLGFTVVREKIEQIVYDTKTGRGV